MSDSDSDSFHSFNDDDNDSLFSLSLSVLSEQSYVIETFEENSAETVHSTTLASNIDSSFGPETEKKVPFKHSPLLNFSKTLKKCFANNVKKRNEPEVRPSFKDSPLQKLSSKLRVYFDKK
nr:uncharacterized protein LOC122321612 [Drosophila bipectinata]